MNTCEELIKRIEEMTGNKPIVGNNNRPVMVADADGEWVKKQDVIKEVRNAA